MHYTTSLPKGALWERLAPQPVKSRSQTVQRFAFEIQLLPNLKHKTNGIQCLVKTSIGGRKGTRKNIRTESHQTQKRRIRKDFGSKKTKRNRKQADDVSICSSGRSCISTSSNVARALKIRILKLSPKHDEALQNRQDLMQILHFSPPVPIAAPPTQTDIAGPSALQSTHSAWQLTPILPKEKCTIQLSDTFDSDNSSVRRNKRPLKKQKKPPSLNPS